MAVAFSGGRDSLALLHATVHAAPALGLQVVALHVHHGLMAEADAWLAQAQALCRRWQRAGWPLRLRWHRVPQRPAAGDSVEAWARRHRQEALARMAREEGASLLLLAHHRRDQAETVLLQALRGAGPRGLAAMPAQIEREGLTWARPWLAQPRAAIEAYVHRHRLRPTEDPSNADARFARNRLRLTLWPALGETAEAAEMALLAVAAQAQEARVALDELASIDLAAAADARGLSHAPWVVLSPARRANALRAWLRQGLGRGAPESLVKRLQGEWQAGSACQWPAGDGLVVRAYRGHLHIASTVADETVAGPAPPARWAIDLSRPGDHALPIWRGTLRLELVRAGGLPLAALHAAELRPRAGAEQFQRAPNTPPRSLKKQYQLAAVPATERSGPLLWLDDRLAWVPGLGVDARCMARPGTPQLLPRWLPDPPRPPHPGRSPQAAGTAA